MFLPRRIDSVPRPICERGTTILCGRMSIMEKIPEFRVVGDASEEVKQVEKEKLKKSLSSNIEGLSEKRREMVRQFEIPKSVEQLALVDFANGETDRLMRELGLEPHDIPPENYHIVPKEIYAGLNKMNDESFAVTFYKDQSIFFNGDYSSNLVYFGNNALHESLHLKGHLTFEVEQNEEHGTTVTPYRQGVSASASEKLGYGGKFHRHFDGLHEAIVSAQEKVSFKRMMELPILQKEKEYLNLEETKEKQRRKAAKYNVPEDEIFWVNKEDEFCTFFFSLPQREVLNYICEEIKKDHPEKYSTPQDVFKEFLKAQFTGQLLILAHLVENSFGKGSFRVLGDMGVGEASGVECLEKLKERRIK
jgi:hypothetical protein